MSKEHNIMAIYGDTIYQLDETHTKIPKLNSNPAYRMPFCHQSVFVKTALLKKHHFDTRFKICADNAFFTTIYKQGARFFYANTIVSIYNTQGISSKPNWQYFKEELIIISRVNRFYILPFTLKYLCMLGKYTLKSLLPQKLSLKIQSIYNAK